MQACDLVPVVEPEILIDGDYDIHRSSAVSQEVLQVSRIIARLLPSLKIEQQPADLERLTKLRVLNIRPLSRSVSLKSSRQQHSEHITAV